MKFRTFIFAAPISGVAAQLLAYFWLTRWSNISPASPSIAYWFAFFCAQIFYWIPLLGFVGGISAVRLLKEKNRWQSTWSGIALNSVLLFGGGAWALHGL